MNTKIPIPLNLPKDKSLTFEDVSFVEDMSEYQLKVFIKRMWQNLMAMANTFEEVRPDVQLVLDKIMGGIKWNKKDVMDRYIYGIYENIIVIYDSKDNTFEMIDRAYNRINDPIKGMTKTMAKEIKKRK